MLVIALAFYAFLILGVTASPYDEEGGIVLGIAFFLLFVILFPAVLLIIRLFCNDENKDKVDSLMTAGGIAMTMWIIIMYTLQAL